MGPGKISQNILQKLLAIITRTRWQRNRKKKQKVNHFQVEYLGVREDIGRGLKNTEGIKPIEQKEAIDSQDEAAWKEETMNEYKYMIDNNAFEVAQKRDLAPGTKKIDSTWACKKKT